MEAEDIERYLAELGAELKTLLDRYILPSGQQKNAESIEDALNRLFGREPDREI